MVTTIILYSSFVLIFGRIGYKLAKNQEKEFNAEHQRIKNLYR